MGRSREYFSWPCCQKEDHEIMAWREDEAKGLDKGTEGLGARDKTSVYIKFDAISGCSKVSHIPTPKTLTPNLAMIYIAEYTDISTSWWRKALIFLFNFVFFLFVSPQWLISPCSSHGITRSNTKEMAGTGNVELPLFNQVLCHTVRGQRPVNKDFK